MHSQYLHLSKGRVIDLPFVLRCMKIRQIVACPRKKSKIFGPPDLTPSASLLYPRNEIRPARLGIIPPYAASIINPFKPIGVKWYTPKRLAPYWSNIHFQFLTFGHSGAQD